VIIHGDCIEVMAGMDPESVDAIVTDPPYGLSFMGKEWDSFGVQAHQGGNYEASAWRPHAPNAKAVSGYMKNGRRGLSIDQAAKANPAMEAFHFAWAEAAYLVAKPSAYLLAFGGTRTVHRMTVALEDAGWIIRDMLVWGYASGFPKSKASLKPAWEPIVMARKPGPLRDLAIDACRIPADYEADYGETWLRSGRQQKVDDSWQGPPEKREGSTVADRVSPLGRWPANIVLTDPIFDGGIEGVVGGGEAGGGSFSFSGERAMRDNPVYGVPTTTRQSPDNYGDSGTYSRFFLVPKSSRDDREPILPPLYCRCETVKLRSWSGISPLRDTDEETSTDDSASNTTSSGSEPTDRSPRDSTSTTSTATNRTTPSTTSSPSTASPTSASTPAASSEMAPGGSDATSATSGSRSTRSTSTSDPKDGRSTADASPATSASSSRRSVCAECGREVMPSSGARINAHPT